ncbi:hypothetical protein HGM15179_016285 [Zosterops borbonicus]|uniref:Uncharacterized protein n=1 Tax=Zosterops borbonicus TaxID=364589 RepID=A0A8K1LEF5_9PASS|nr:hypothetical protein HGM15179_016284 [Zosterops borbonicus]TRZ10816.1 hypothetical protein HGM15179_016285 [Zosterops borbonicus]
MLRCWSRCCSFSSRNTAPLVHDVISIIMGQCCEEAQRLLCFAAVRDENNGPVASSTSSSSSSSQQGTPDISPTSSDEEEEAGTSEVSPCPGQQSQPLCAQGRDRLSTGPHYV